MFILGIDQGSTQTRAAICDERGQLLGLGIAAGACHSIHGMEAAMHAVQLAVEAALSQAGLEKKPLPGPSQACPAPTGQMSMVFYTKICSTWGSASR